MKHHIITSFLIIFITTIAIYLSVTQTSAIIKPDKIPVIMYHKIVENAEETTDFVITDKMLEEDFKEIKSRGYTTFTVSEFDIACREAEKGVKPIIITFDDGYKGIYTYALPLMKKYNFKASFYICGEFIDNNHPEYCSWDEIALIGNSELAEIGNHTYSLHNLTKEELEQLYITDWERAETDITKNNSIIEKNTGIKPVSFSFPYGVYTDKSIKLLYSSGFNILVSTDYTANESQTTILGRFNRPASFDTKEFFNMVDEKCK